ncbi:relaxase/mobilization nuclease domain-containing protein [Runella slithyformis]|uniref:Relaxase/mobilization nuclease family protein n=1 Tax=Runella slithyformis (strain ATCC 29530 / DSM 19594 / LMG 11500 / NCIMB 11436 / LSU 4) TaxID=761193 RepID=A0A7U3ZRR4_RUNSL|nr:relaxase/mobilization nuclease domain-containing protein [Runella slithyformis]AEI52117.1 Relaxase/mobilization nuclease family protein [Runella slithyformis DSM 19594]
MIAKALGTGKSFSGKINYLFDGKIEDRKVKDKMASVISHSENVRVPFSHEDKTGISRMKADFIERSKSYKYFDKSKGYIGEHVISLTEHDQRELRGKGNMKSITDEYIKLTGIDKTQYVAITHHDTSNPHVHILFNRVTDAGKIFDATYEKKRAMYAGIVLSQKYGLSLLGELQKVSEDKGVKVMRMQMGDYRELRAGNALLREARNFHHLEKLAEAKGQTLEQRGDSVFLDKKEYSKADLETMFWQNRTEALTAKSEKGSVQALVEAKSVDAGQPVTISPIVFSEEGTAQVTNEKRESRVSKPTASVEEGKAKRSRKKRLPDYQQKVTKLKTSKGLRL